MTLRAGLVTILLAVAAASAACDDLPRQPLATAPSPVPAPPPPRPVEGYALSVTPDVVGPGGDLLVKWTAPSGGKWDWIGIFAVGAVMFTLLSGHWVHDAATDQELLVKMLTLPAPPLAKLLPQAPAGLCQVVDRALAFEQADRYPDALTMQRDIRALREGREPPYASQPQPPRPSVRIEKTVASSPHGTVVSQAAPALTPVAASP